MESKKGIHGHLLVSVTVFIWGTTFISTKILLRSFSPVAILFLRFLTGFLALLLVYPHRLRVEERKRELYFAGAGLCGITLYYLLENMALIYSFASNVGVIISTAPFFTAMLAHFFPGGEKLRLRFFAGFVVALTGIFLISVNGVTNFQLNPLGDLFALLAAMLWAVYSVLTRKIGEFGYNNILVTRRIFFYGLVLALPALFFFPLDLEVNQVIQPVNIFNILFLGLGASALCFATWNAALKILGAVKTSAYIYMVPVVTAASSSIVLSEKITGLALLGIILTLAGLFISQGKTGTGRGKGKGKGKEVKGMGGFRDRQL
ncbi:MAG: DMT family transporter [Clostridia bacterium]|nr:DMT family transporter [Clostridia bacterium]